MNAKEPFRKGFTENEKPEKIGSGRSTEYCSKQFLKTCEHLKEAEQEIQKWEQQQKDDYATYLQKVEELQHKADDNYFLAQKYANRVDDLEQKLDSALQILNEWGSFFVSDFDRARYRKWIERLRTALETKKP